MRRILLITVAFKPGDLQLHAPLRMTLWKRKPGVGKTLNPEGMNTFKLNYIEINKVIKIIECIFSAILIV